jgi:hypothetical protein
MSANENADASAFFRVSPFLKKAIPIHKWSPSHLIPRLSTIFPRLSHLIPRLSTIFPRLSHLIPRLSKIIPRLSE